MSFLSSSDKKRNKSCLLCTSGLTDSISYPECCKHLYHYECLRKYVDNQLESKKPVICPEKICKKFFGRIAYTYKNSNEIVYQNAILSNDESQCCICFSKYTIPVAKTDSCSHTFCCECLKRWCTFKHECPMDRTPIKMLLISDFPGGLIIRKIEPPAIEQDLNGDGDNDELINTTCEFCNSGQNEHQLLLCDNCNRGYHMYCLPVPLLTIPDGDWFCEQCQEHGDNQHEIIQVDDGGLQRGLGRVVADYQNRFGSDNVNRPRNNTTNGRRTRRLTRQNARISDSEVSSEDEVISRTRGVRTRRQRHVLDIENEVEEELGINSRLRRQDSVRENSSDNIILSRRRPVAVIEEPEEDVEETVGLRLEVRTATRRRQGSLSSDIESEVEPRRKKMRRLVLSEDENENDEENSASEKSSSSSTEEEEEEDAALVSSPIITRLRARDNNNHHAADEPPLLPMGVEDEDATDENVDDDEEDEVVVHSVNNHPKRRPCLESDSSDDETDRVRHVSTSSSLSTIPCRITDSMETSVTRPKSVKAAQELEIETDLFNSSIASEQSTVDSETDWQPSTSRHKLRPHRRAPQRRSSRIKKAGHREGGNSPDVIAMGPVATAPPTNSSTGHQRITISIRRAAPHVDHDRPSSSHQQPEQSSTLQPPATVDDTVAKVVSRSLVRYQREEVITDEEAAKVATRIIEKVTSSNNKRNGGDGGGSDRPPKKKVKEYVAKYMSFYLAKRR